MSRTNFSGGIENISPASCVSISSTRLPPGIGPPIELYVKLPPTKLPDHRYDESDGRGGDQGEGHAAARRARRWKSARVDVSSHWEVSNLEPSCSRLLSAGRTGARAPRYRAGEAPP